MCLLRKLLKIFAERKLPETFSGSVHGNKKVPLPVPMSGVAGMILKAADMTSHADIMKGNSLQMNKSSSELTTSEKLLATRRCVNERKIFYILKSERFLRFPQTNFIQSVGFVTDFRGSSSGVT